ncbi:hypothetical protein [Streptomyces canus]|uniref:hypothetical protein n=1 Tax=Streptomyces canus TaxID=58343 RepID=UPI00380BEA09
MLTGLPRPRTTPVRATDARLRQGIVLLRTALPDRTVSLTARWTPQVGPEGDPVRVRLTGR